MSFFNDGITFKDLQIRYPMDLSMKVALRMINIMEKASTITSTEVCMVGMGRGILMHEHIWNTVIPKWAPKPGPHSQYDSFWDNAKQTNKNEEQHQNRLNKINQEFDKSLPIQNFVRHYIIHRTRFCCKKPF